MFERLVDSIRKSPSKVALAVMILALVLNFGIAGLWFQRTRTANVLAAHIAVIQENLVHVEEIEEEEIEELRAQLTAAEDQLASLRRGLAGTEVPFDLFAEVFDMAEQSGLGILSVEREEVGTQDTSDGSLTATRFSFQVEGEFPAFIEFVENLEAAAPKSVSLDGMLVTQEERSCLFEVIVLSGLEVESP